MGFSRQEYWSGLPFPSPGESSRPRDRTQVSCIGGRHFTIWATWEALTQSESEVTQLCPTLCNPMDYSLPGPSIHGIFQARILEWVAISFSRRSSQPRGWTQVSHIVGRHFTIWATREVYWPDSGIEPESPVLQADSLPTELSGKKAVTKTILKKNKCKKTKWMSEETSQINEERREANSKGERERCPTECIVPENSNKR